MTAIITGGGTGGHLSIAKSLALECKKRGFFVAYIGSMSGQDRLWFEKSDIFDECHFLKTSGVVNKKGFGKIQSLYFQALAAAKCVAILRRLKADFVLSVGGFSAGGAALAAIMTRTPLFIHEQNAIFGTLNALLSPFARLVFGSFAINAKNFVATSYPVSPEFFATSRTRSSLKTLLILGGSQGAKALNHFGLTIAKDLQNRGIRILHQCGALDFEATKMGYEKLGFVCLGSESKGYATFAPPSGKNAQNPVQIELFSFSRDLAKKMSEADFCISRSGASSLWELCANGLPSYFVPYPFAFKNHQFFNAAFLKKQGICEVKRQEDLNAADFFGHLEDTNLQEVSQRLKDAIKPSGSREIVGRILKELGGKEKDEKDES